MTTHISEDLPRLLTGDATRDEVLAAAAHLRTCPDCQQELISAVVAHASLTSAHRFAPEIVARDSSTHAVEDEPAGPLPDMSAMFAKVREEATTNQAKPKQRQHRLLAVAAAALVLTGGGITLAETVGSGSAQTASRTISLDAFDKGTHKAKVTIVGDGTMRIDATSLPRLDAGHSYEVWLTDGARQRMQSVGWIGSNNKAQIAVPPKVMSQYSDIEVSVQRTNQTPYSGISVLRGAYATS
jgi:hypothetical protein